MKMDLPLNQLQVDCVVISLLQQLLTVITNDLCGAESNETKERSDRPSSVSPAPGWTSSGL